MPFGLWISFHRDRALPAARGEGGLATTSPGSTQLGEAPLRTARRHRHFDAGSDGSYDVPATCPLYAYGPAPPKRRFLQRLSSDGK